ncbi:MAG: winged helix-turn-helix transcriptional regulator [bacterium]
MNEKITDVLNILDKEDNPSQREIAKKTGFSLGLVNILIKKCAKKGLLKIEKLNSRNIKYILTPEGIKEKTKKTISYVQRSYRAIQKIQNKVAELAGEYKNRTIYILENDNDEITELVQDTLKRTGIDYSMVDSPEKANNNNAIIFHWDPDLNPGDYEQEVVNIFR